MSNGPPVERLACLIVARNLGDAVIQSGFLQALAARDYAHGYLAWVRPQVAFLFRDIPQCEVVCSQFPLGTQKQFGGAEIIRFARAAWRIRQLRPSVTLDLIGDLRERMCARLLGAPRHLHIGWAEGHPFARIIRNPLGPGKPFITVPATVPNVYAAHRLMLEALAPGRTDDVRSPSQYPLRRTGALRVGLHPFASQECKMWPAHHWRELIIELRRQSAEITVFSAPAERDALVRLLGDQASAVHSATGSLESFAKEVAGLDILVGLDSFAVHMAWRQGVRSVLINAGNPPELWSVPSGGRTLASSGGCPLYPCFNVPGCTGTEREYACVKSVTVRQVIESIQFECSAQPDSRSVPGPGNA